MQYVLVKRVMYVTGISNSLGQTNNVCDMQLLYLDAIDSTEPCSTWVDGGACHGACHRMFHKQSARSIYKASPKYGQTSHGFVPSHCETRFVWLM